MIYQRLLALLMGAPTWGASTIATSTVGAELGATSTTYERGIMVENLDASIDIYLSPTLAGLASATTRYTLKAGQVRVIPFSNPAGIFAKSASGTPSLSWIAA